MLPSLNTGTLAANIAYMKPDDDRFREEKPYVSLVPFLSDGSRFTNTEVEDHIVEITNVRGSEAAYDLDRNGFAYATYRSQERPSHDIKGPDHPYMKEMARFLKRHLGARDATVYDANTRRVGDSNFLQASLYAHVDHSVENARWRVEQLMAQRKEAIPKRWQFINLWIPIKGPVQGSPIAVCDYQTIDRGDLVAVDSVFPHRVMEVYHVKFNNKHRWYYMDQQDVNDILIFKTCDSEGENGSCCVHSAVVPDADNKVVRESIEVRTIVTY